MTWRDLRSLLAQLWCAGWRGHDEVLHFEGTTRVLLRCTSCGHDSPGWKVAGRVRT